MSIFLTALLCLATGREVPPQPAYKIGYRTRLISQDVDWIKNRFLYRPDVQVGMEIVNLLRPVTGRESWDYFDWGDLAVIAADFRDLVRKNFNR